MEAFGQSEALTTRLRHIITNYADGPGILMELIQVQRATPNDPPWWLAGPRSSGWFYDGTRGSMC